MKRTLQKIIGRKWARAEIEIENGCLRMRGSYGRVLTEAAAKRDALRYWVSFFEEQPDQIYDMKKRYPQFRGWSPKAAAKFVLAVDGPYHGLDLQEPVGGGGVLVTDGRGQCGVAVLAVWPELAKLLPWHLNDLHAECEHQQSRGEKMPGAICPDCGWKLGHAWSKRELPSDIVKLAETIGTAK